MVHETELREHSQRQEIVQGSLSTTFAENEELRAGMDEASPRSFVVGCSLRQAFAGGGDVDPRPALECHPRANECGFALVAGVHERHILLGAGTLGVSARREQELNALDDVRVTHVLGRSSFLVPPLSSVGTGEDHPSWRCRTPLPPP